MIMARPQNASRQTRGLLGVLLAQPRTWRHGYALSQETGLKSGTLYPLLIRLNDQGLLDSKWREPERPGRPPRHVYRLTVGGVALARHLTEEPTESRFSRKSFGAGA
jgi:PadR family transcriptional regulator PadR